MRRPPSGPVGRWPWRGPCSRRRGCRPLRPGPPPSASSEAEVAAGSPTRWSASAGSLRSPSRNSTPGAPVARAEPSSRRPAFAVVFLVLLLLGAGSIVPSGRAASPVLPVIDGSQALSGVSSPVESPGAGGTVTMVVGDPLAVPIQGVVVSLEVYAFN